MPSMQDFINYTPVGRAQYSAYDPMFMNGMRIEFLGIKENVTHFTAIAGAENLNEFIRDRTDQLWQWLDVTAPEDTGLYRQSINVEEDGNYGAKISIGKDVNNRSGFNYAKFIIYGARTLYNAAQSKRWPESYTYGTLGIIHNVQGILAEWERMFWEDMDDVQFTQPRSAGGQFTKVFNR